MSSTDTITDAPRARAAPMEWIARPGPAPAEAVEPRRDRLDALAAGEVALADAEVGGAVGDGAVQPLPQ